jgi:tRNA dimethylallyltransferase
MNWPENLAAEDLGGRAGMAIVPIIVGPTGVGKTEICLGVAERIGAEIVSADSRQIYRHMEIGTAKPTSEQRQRVPHHLVDCVDPDQEFNAARYGLMANKVICQLLAAGKLPMVVGGSGLYIRALLGAFFQGPGANAEIRKKLAEEEAQRGRGTLHHRLAEVDPQTANRIHPHDRVRTIRALEVHQLTGIPLSQWHRRGPYSRPKFGWCKLGLYRSRTNLYQRIEERIDAMMAQGLLKEVQALLSRGYSPDLPALATVGYQEMIAYIKGKLDLEQAVSHLKRNTRQYAKRQMTWFSKEGEILWFDAQREEEQLLLTVQDLKAGKTPQAEEIEDRRASLRHSWLLKDSPIESDGVGL